MRKWVKSRREDGERPPEKEKQAHLGVSGKCLSVAPHSPHPVTRWGGAGMPPLLPLIMSSGSSSPTLIMAKPTRDRNLGIVWSITRAGAIFQRKQQRVPGPLRIYKAVSRGLFLPHVLTDLAHVHRETRTCGLITF